MEQNTEVTGSPVKSQVRYQTRSHMAIAGIQERNIRSFLLIRNVPVTRRNRNTVPAASVENTSDVGFNTMVIRNASPATAM